MSHVVITLNTISTRQRRPRNPGWHWIPGPNTTPRGLQHRTCRIGIGFRLEIRVKVTGRTRGRRRTRRRGRPWSAPRCSCGTCPGAPPRCPALWPAAAPRPAVVCLEIAVFHRDCDVAQDLGGESALDGSGQKQMAQRTRPQNYG